MFSHSTKIRIAYGHTDKMGFLFHGHYPHFFSVARTEAIRSLGMSYKQLEDRGIIMPVAKLQMHFIRPAAYDDVLRFETTVRLLEKDRISFHYNVFKEDERICTRATVNLVFMDAKIHERVNMPDELMNKLSPYFNE